MRELAPGGLPGLRDGQEFDRRYVQRLEDVGPDRLTERFAAIVAARNAGARVAVLRVRSASRAIVTCSVGGGRT
jgi:hypothetical protein